MKLSIIVPMYNAELNIENTLNTVLHQMVSDVELILVDDGSSDNTVEICKNIIKQRTDNINVIITKNQHSKGVSGARNTGIDLARGEYISFLDSDDILKANYVKRILQEIEQGDRPDLAIYGYETYQNHDRISSKILPLEEKYCTIDEFMQNYFSKLFLDWLMNACWNKLFKKETILLNRIAFPEESSMGEDLAFVLGILKYARCVHIIPEILYGYVSSNGERLTSRFRVDKLETQMRNYIKICDLEKRYCVDKNTDIQLRFYDDIQAYLSEAYFEAGMGIRSAKKVLDNILTDDTCHRIIDEVDQERVTDWKLAYLKARKKSRLHYLLLIKRWRGRLARWIRQKKL